MVIIRHALEGSITMFPRRQELEMFLDLVVGALDGGLEIDSQRGRCYNNKFGCVRALKRYFDDHLA